MSAPPLPDSIAATALDPAARRDLGGLQKDVAESVARHLVAAGTLVDTDPQTALAHARYARRRASRIAVVREAAGIAAYHAGEWAEALAELRAARRMGGGPGHLAVMADAERAMGRPERAVELSRSAEARELDRSAQVELAIVVAGARRDLGELDAAVVALQVPELDPTRRDSWSARLFYAYADNLLAAERESDALQWFVHALDADPDGQTDADARVAELTGEPLVDEGIEFGPDDIRDDDAVDDAELGAADADDADDDVADGNNAADATYTDTDTDDMVPAGAAEEAGKVNAGDDVNANNVIDADAGDDAAVFDDTAVFDNAAAVDDSAAVDHTVLVDNPAAADKAIAVDDTVAFDNTAVVGEADAVDNADDDLATVDTRTTGDIDDLDVVADADEVDDIDDADAVPDADLADAESVDGVDHLAADTDHIAVVDDADAQVPGDEATGAPAGTAVDEEPVGLVVVVEVSGEAGAELAAGVHDTADGVIVVADDDPAVAEVVMDVLVVDPLAGTENGPGDGTDAEREPALPVGDVHESTETDGAVEEPDDAGTEPGGTDVAVSAAPEAEPTGVVPTGHDDPVDVHATRSDHDPADVAAPVPHGAAGR